jgi:hypothetical protein
MMGQSRPVNRRESKFFNGLGRFDPRELHKQSLRSSQLDRSILRREFEHLHQASPWSGFARVDPPHLGRSDRSALRQSKSERPLNPISQATPRSGEVLP